MAILTSIIFLILCFCVPKYSHTNCACKVSTIVLSQNEKASTGDFMRYLYWAAAFMAFLINVGYTTVRSHLIIIFISNHPTIISYIIQPSNIPCTIPSDTSVYNDEVLTLVAKFTIIPVAVFMELLISVHTVKNNYNIRLRFIGCRRSSLKHYLLQTLWMLALWNILMSLQLFSMLVNPLCVLLLIRPQMTLSIQYLC